MEKKPNLLHLLKYKHTNKNEITLLCEHWMFKKKKKNAANRQIIVGNYDIIAKCCC